METSKKWTLDLIDYGKAFIMAVLSAVIGGLVSMAQAGNTHFDPKTILAFAISGAGAYLLHALPQVSQVIITPTTLLSSPVSDKSNLITAQSQAAAIEAAIDKPVVIADTAPIVVSTNTTGAAPVEQPGSSM
jgi:hypothetical protein